ncbi:MAG: RNA polymerase sigma factor [Armatimonadetes bacterium]|nr:RNA polymerase sigma factor [Anaerolineae bacterium]
MALDVLVARFHGALMGYLYRLTHGDRPLAEDLAQETFVRVLRHIDQYQYPRSFKAWLYAIATHTARNHYASADQRYTHTTDWSSDDDQPLAGEPGLEANLIQDEAAHAVAAALARLPDTQRIVILLTYYQGLRLQETADALGIPLGTVKSRLSNGIARLRAVMKLEEP